MEVILNINNLNYKYFHDINLSFEREKLYFIVGPNKSGKTTLFRIMSSLIPTNNVISCDKVLLNKKNQKLYIRNIGVVERVNTYSFNYKTVLSEMLYPLLNLNYSLENAKKRINYILNYYNISYLLDKKINELDIYEKQKLLLAISLLHKPKVLFLDGVLEIFSIKERKNIIKLLKKYISEEHISIIIFTTSLDDITENDQIILLSKYKIIKECFYNDLYNYDQLFYQNNLEIPFMIDLSIKLKTYNLINKNYTNKENLVDDLWD